MNVFAVQVIGHLNSEPGVVYLLQIIIALPTVIQMGKFFVIPIKYNAKICKLIKGTNPLKITRLFETYSNIQLFILSTMTSIVQM